MSKKTFAIPGQRRRPALDAALETLERIAQRGCGICGDTSFSARYGGSAVWDGETMTPWMCPDCARAREEKPDDH